MIEGTENADLASWQCVHLDGKTGITSDEHGNQSCAKDAVISRLTSDKKSLRKALRPFAKMCVGYNSSKHNYRGSLRDDELSEDLIRVGDLRRASRTMKETRL